MGLTKAYLTIEGSQEELHCLYNPESFSVSLSNSWDSTPTAGAGVQQARFGGSESGTMSLNLTFDTTAQGVAVTTYTSKLVALMKPSIKIKGATDEANNLRPPTVTFHWGATESFPSAITSLNLNFTYFSSDGTPLRAEVGLSLKQYDVSDAFGPQNPTSGTPKPHQVHRVQPGETLDRISAHYYGDATRWRALAIANGLEDPLGIRPGLVLAIPKLDA
jgi:nucleoid-associated protein YgaU